jgi:hypothetical protein
MDEETLQVIIRFIDIVRDFETKVKNDFRQYTDNPSRQLLRTITNKYPHLKRHVHHLTKRTKRILAKTYVHEILKRIEYRNSFTPDEKKVIYKYCIKKIKGVYKHAQALKTGYCNLKIINGFSIDNLISVCITKNTLESNEQWLERLFKELNNRFPHILLKDKIMLISSKKNDLNGNATHCKDMNAAWGYLRRENNFKIIFVCSNQIRINDILDMALDFQNLNEGLQKNLQILHDEAHNAKEGIPAYRDIIENIILQLNVLFYIPITASNRTIAISDEEDPLWKKENLENNAENYSEFDKTKSTDPSYSSCRKSVMVSFEELRQNPSWSNYGVTQIPKHIFESIYGADYIKYEKFGLNQLKEALQDETALFKKQDISADEIDIDEIMANIEVYPEPMLIQKIKAVNMERRRTLEFCSFMKNDKELEAVNNGLNWLHLNEIMGQQIFIPNKRDIYIMSTPSRRGITAYLAEKAAKQPYNPIVLAIYGSEGDKYHVYINGEEWGVDDIMDTGEFNIKLDKLFAFLIQEGYDINRPFIIIGNYVPTGESLTFVNYTYGTVRVNTRLISTNAEEDYQESARSNYMTTKFIEMNPEWTMPEKFLIGPDAFLKNALSYEDENDARIDSMVSENVENSTEISVSSAHTEVVQVSGGITAIPIKMTIDWSHPRLKDMEPIMEKRQRTPQEKAAFLNWLKELNEDEDSGFEMVDKTGKFNFVDFTINRFRCYRRKETGPNPGEWKFTSYENHHRVETPFINETNSISINECDLLTCMDNYILKDENGNIKEKNNKSTWWMSYKYAPVSVI